MGGDIDAAIVYDVLIPQLLEQNGLPPRSFGFSEKRNQIEPALRPIAEGLKIGLSQEQARRARLGLPPDPELKRQFPGRHSIAVSGQSLELTTPVLTAKAFSAVLQPFFDRNVLAPRSDEYRTARSIFAPIHDAIERSGMTLDEIDLCLTVGGSSNIPLVTEALRELLPRAQAISYEDAEDRKACVARGAAIAAAFTAVTGQRLITPVSFDEIAVLTQEGRLVLIPAGQPLPFPSDGRAAQVEVLAPQSSAEAPLPIRVAIVAGREQRTVFEATWDLAAPVRTGELLTIQFRFDGDQVLDLRLHRSERPDQPPLNATIASPLTHVQNPIAKEVEAEKLEREIAGGRLDPLERQRKALELVDLLDELGQWEKALATLRAVQAQQRAPDAGILNWMALILDKLGDHEEAYRLFEQATEADRDWDGSLFNLALMYRRRRELEKARHAIERALQRNKEGPSLTLRALIAKDAGDETQKKASLLAASSAWPPLRGMSEWMLGWYTVWARESGDDAALRTAENERKRRHLTRDTVELGGILPSKGERHA